MDQNLSADELYAAIEAAERESAAAETQHGHCIALVFTHPIVADDGHAFFGPLVRAARARATTLGCDFLISAPSQDHWLEAELAERCAAPGANGPAVLRGADGHPHPPRSPSPGPPAALAE